MWIQSDMKKTQTCCGQILEVHKLPQKVCDHDMYIKGKNVPKKSKIGTLI